MVCTRWASSKHHQKHFLSNALGGFSILWLNLVAVLNFLIWDHFVVEIGNARVRILLEQLQLLVELGLKYSLLVVWFRKCQASECSSALCWFVSVHIKTLFLSRSTGIDILCPFEELIKEEHCDKSTWHFQRVAETRRVPSVDVAVKFWISWVISFAEYLLFLASVFQQMYFHNYTLISQLYMSKNILGIW